MHIEENHPMTNDSPMSPNEIALRDAACEYHRAGTHGKISVRPTKPLANQRDLSLAYSPGVAYPCLEIQANQPKPPNTPPAPTW